MAWHRAATGDPVIALSALEWSLPAMRGAVRRLAVLGAADPATVLALINDAIWAVTIVDAAMVRYHPEVYERVLAAGPMADRQVIEESLAGLRFVRNQIHDEAMLAELVEPGRAQRGAGQAGLPDWTWKPPPGPAAERGARAQAWATARQQGYQAQLAGHPVGEVFERAATFLDRIAAEVTVVSDEDDPGVVR